MVTKLFLFNLTQFEQVAYFDSDVIFLRNPWPIFASCGAAELCAVKDKAAVGRVFRPLPDGSRMKRYFNAGVMIIRPNSAVFDTLMQQKALADSKAFAEQDMLNVLFHKSWKSLPGDYNVISPKKVWSGREVAVHEKWWRIFPGSRWVYNNSRLSSALVEQWKDAGLGRLSLGDGTPPVGEV